MMLSELVRRLNYLREKDIAAGEDTVVCVMATTDRLEEMPITDMAASFYRDKSAPEKNTYRACLCLSAET